MTITELKNLIDQRESAKLEFKSSLTQLRPAFETLCAFLNACGGTVLIGVKNDGSVSGQTVTDNTRTEIANLITKLEPPISLESDYIEITKNTYVIKLSTPETFNDKPYVFNSRPFWRVESSTTTMPQQLYQQLLIEKALKTDRWELANAKEFTIDDLDKDEILRTIEESVQRGRMEAHLATHVPIEALRRLKLLVNDKLINATVILFCKDPLPFYPQCLLRLARFKGHDKSTIIDSKRIYGNAFHLIAEAEDFVLRHMSVRSEFTAGKMARKDIPEYAPRAVREALINAICHRDYTIQGGSVSLMMYDDRLEVTSHGTLPRGVTVDKLKVPHESQPRNEIITHVMYRRGFIESVGTGTQEMLKESLVLGKPEPIYIEAGNTFTVCFKAQGLGDIVSADVTAQLNERQKKILLLLLDCTEAKPSEISQRSGAEVNERTLRRDLNHLKEIGLVGQRGKGPNTVWYLLKSDKE